MNSKVSTASIIVMASGAVMLLFSFFDWFGGDGFGVSAWSSDVPGLDPFPLLTYAPIFGAICAGLVAVTAFGNVKLPTNIAGFTVRQIIKALGIFSVLLIIGIWIFVGGDGVDTELGLWLNLLGAIGLVVGGFMMDQEATAAGPTTQGPATPF